MTSTTVHGIGAIVSFTTLCSLPQGFRTPLQIALVELRGGARVVCHGIETRDVRLGEQVTLGSVDSTYYFAWLGALRRVRLFWRRASHESERVHAMTRSLAKWLRRWRATE